MSEFTKGPWGWIPADKSGYNCELWQMDENGDVTDSVLIPKVVTTGGLMELVLSSYENYTTEKANAHLIAAAPDMYEALKDVLSTLEGLNQGAKYSNDKRGYPCEEEMSQINKVLAKAEGREE